MFTGIIHGLGAILEMKKLNNQLQIRIQPEFKINDFQLGESMAVNGCCLSVTKFSRDWFEAYVSAETFFRTNLKNLKIKNLVNLERAVKLNDRLGGHIITGHIDETTTIKKIQPVGASKIVTFAISQKNSKYLIEKGSITLDGISLTIIGCGKRYCKVNLNPETFNNTTAVFWYVGYKINIEVDALVKSVNIPTKQNGISISKDFLFAHGYL